jgi:hypothetical protein
MTGYQSKKKAAQDKLDSMEREALKLALEALRMADELCRGHGVDFKEYGLEFDRDIQVKYKDAITTIKEALAQPAQEPVDDYIASIIAARDLLDGQPVPDSLYFKDLAQPAQEPVAWLDTEWGDRICPEVGYEATITEDHPRNLGWIPLFAQRPWVDLTEDQIKVIEEMALTKQWAIRMALAAVKERNA